MKYFAPLSSPKQKHLKMKNDIDFYKLSNGKLGAINFNNMIPVPDGSYTLIGTKTQSLTYQEQKYKALLRNQLRWLNPDGEKLRDIASNLYMNRINNTLPFRVQKRCCDFQLLEEKCREYTKMISTKSFQELEYDEINEMTNVFVSYETIRKARKVAEIEFTCHFKDTNEVINGEFEEKDIPSIFSTLAWDEIENNLEYGSLEYVIAEIQYTSKELLGKEELSKAELNIIKELYDLYGGRMMIVASREASTYEKYSLYYIRELMKTWIMKGYSVEDVENGKR